MDGAVQYMSITAVPIMRDKRPRKLELKVKAKKEP